MKTGQGPLGCFGVALTQQSRPIERVKAQKIRGVVFADCHILGYLKSANLEGPNLESPNLGHSK